MRQEKYKLPVKCTNCFFQGLVEIEVGIKVDEVPCPKCKCESLKRNPGAGGVRAMNLPEPEGPGGGLAEQLKELMEEESETVEMSMTVNSTARNL